MSALAATWVGVKRPHPDDAPMTFEQKAEFVMGFVGILIGCIVGVAAVIVTA